MSTVESAEQLAQAAIDVGVLDDHQLQSVWGELGTRNVSVEDFTQALLRRNLLTSYQVERLLKGLRHGYFFGDYKVLYCVGAGTFARVYRAAHRDTNQLYAVKVLRTSLSQDKEQAEAFLREGELGQSLKHANIVPIHEVVAKRGVYYIVMDFIEGRNLREFFKVRGKFEALEALRILEGVMAGLAYASTKGVGHRDLKMSNVLVSSDGVAKLVDFGLAALEDEGPTEAGNKRTVEYAALERATGVRKDDARSDIYFAGCMLYQMLTGHNPMPEGRDRMNKFSRTTFTEIPPILSLNPNIPPMVAKVVNKAIEFDPEKRYQTPGDMLADIKILIRRLEAGAEHDGAGQQQLVSNEGLDDAGEPRKLMVVESDVKLQNLFRDLFKKHGYRVLVTSDPQRAVDRLVQDPQAAQVVLFTSMNVGRAALEVFNGMATAAGVKDLPAVLLLDERHAAWKAEAMCGQHRTALVMPVKQRELRQAVQQALLRQVGETAA